MNYSPTLFLRKLPYLILYIVFAMPSFVSSLSARQASQTSSKSVSDTTQIKIPKLQSVNQRIDSLKQALATTKEDTTKIRLLRKIGDVYYDSQESLPYYLKALELIQQLRSVQGNSIKYKDLEAECYNEIGMVQNNLGNFDQALDYYLKSLRIYEEIKMKHPDDIEIKKGIAMNLNNIGVVYKYQGDSRGNSDAYNHALDYYLKALKINEELNDKRSIGYCLNNIGEVYRLQSNYDRALTYYFKSLRIKEELNNKKGIANSLNNIGAVYYAQNKKNSALVYFIRSLKIRQEINEKAGVAISFANIGQIYSEIAVIEKTSAGRQNNFLKSIEFSDSSLNLAREIGEKYLIMETGENLAITYAKISNFKKAYEYHQLYTTYKDSIFNEEKSKEIGKLEANHEFLIQKASSEAKAMALTKKENEKKFRKELMQDIFMIMIIVSLFIGVSLLRKKMSGRLLRFMGFFTTILFFEFVLVLIAPSIVSFTGGAPLWIMLINSAIASILFVPQNFIQNRLSGKLPHEPASGSNKNHVVTLGLVIVGVLNMYSISPSFVMAQTKAVTSQIDSLKQALYNTKEDTTKIQLLRTLGITTNYLQKSLPYLHQALALSIRVKNKLMEANCYNEIGVVHKNLGNYERAVNYYFKSLKIYEEIKWVYLNDMDYKKGLAACLNNFGEVCRFNEDLNQALSYFSKSLKIYEEIKFNKGIATCLNNIGIIYGLQDNYDRELEYYFKSYKIRVELKDKKEIAASLNNIGIVYDYKNIKDSAFIYYRRSLKLVKEIGDKSGAALTYENLGELFSEQGNIEKAIAFSDSSFRIAREIRDKYMMMISGATLATNYSKLNDFKNAYKYHQLYAMYKDSIFNDEKSKEIGKLEAKHDMEMKELERVRKEKEAAVAVTAIANRRNKLQYSVMVLGIFALIGIALLLSRFIVSMWVIEFISFVPFLLLFEGLLVFTDPYLDKFTGSESLYTVMVNTVFAMGLFPLHHGLETWIKKIFYRRSVATL